MIQCGRNAKGSNFEACSKDIAHRKLIVLADTGFKGRWCSSHGAEVL
jgi:hypothetical protein